MNEGLNSEACCVFAWGANSYGQLGLGHKIDGLLPAKCKVEEVVAKRLQLVTGGGGHSVLVTGDGEVYVFGWNKNGQLGVPPSEDLAVPHPLARTLSHCTTKIAKVSCGWNHTLAIGDSGSLIMWGSNAFGQLGTPSIVKQTDRPVVLHQQTWEWFVLGKRNSLELRISTALLVFSDSRILDIAAGLRHSIAVTGLLVNPPENGVYSWGDGKKGQLGHGGRQLIVQPTPKCVTSLASRKCKKVSAGAFHSLAITEDGEMFAWGLNQHGQCGVGTLTDEIKSRVGAECFKVSDSDWIMHVYQPLSIQRLPAVSEVCCGWSHVLAVTIHRQVYTWGRSDYGQLGLGDRKSHDDLHSNQQTDCCQEPREIPELQGAIQVACGSEHSIAISAAKEVVTFGWNEHGMCATGNERNVACPHTVDSLRGWEPVLVGAGAGHSFVVAKQHVAACAAGREKCS